MTQGHFRDKKRFGGAVVVEETGIRPTGQSSFRMKAKIWRFTIDS